MTVKEFFDVFQKTKFECTSNGYAYNHDFIGVGEEYSEFSLDDFGEYFFSYSNNGHRSWIIIEKDSKIYKEYRYIKDLYNDIDVLNMEIVLIKRFTLNNDFYETSYGNRYPNNFSEIEICVK